MSYILRQGFFPDSWVEPMKFAVSAIMPLLIVVCTHAGEVQVIDDFEHGLRAWSLVQGAKVSDAGPLGAMSGSQEAKVGRGAARLQFAACPKSWAHMQMSIRPLDWLANDCDRISLWVKGDGSGEKLTLMFGNYAHKPALCFQYSIVLDFTGWRQVVIPFADFSPRGKMGAHVAALVLAQLHVGATHKPVDVLVDELVALPTSLGKQQRFFDLVVPTVAVWDKPSYAQPLAVDNICGVAAGLVPNGLIHGIRNHKDLHQPVSFVAQYPEQGTFGVKISTTSGHGGSRLILKIDGEEKLRKDFPGKTGTTLTQYQGYYGVPVLAGKHVLTVDNDGTDWLTVEAFCFGNLRSANARLRREDGRLEAILMDATGMPLSGLSVSAAIDGTTIALSSQAGGLWLSDCLWNRFPQGVYPIKVNAQRGDKIIFTSTVTASLGSAHLRPVKTAFNATQDVVLDLLYLSEADVPMAKQSLEVTLGESRFPCVEQTSGVYRAALGKLPAGRYHAMAHSADGHTAEVPFLVYDPAGKPWEQEGLIRLGGNGWFITAEGRPYVPWGYATIGLYAPDSELISRLAGPNAWCHASDEDVRNWIGLLASYGVNCVRFGVTVDAANICGDTGGHASPWMLQRLRHFLDLIGPLGVRAVPVMWWGHYRNFGYQGIPAYDALISKQADWFIKPAALALHQQYVREVVSAFKDDPRILAWEVMNETCRAGDDIEGAIRWSNEIIKTMRECSPKHLVTTSACEATPNPELAWINGANIDFFNYHEYPTYPDYSRTAKLLGGVTHEIGAYAAVMTLSDRLGRRVSLLGETGNDRLREASYPEVRQLITRDCLWLSFLHGSPGGIAWDAIADPREFDVLSQITRQIAWTCFVPAPTSVVVKVMDADKEMANLTEYVWWSLNHGVPISFIRADQSVQPDQQVLPGDHFAPPAKVPPANLEVGSGLQSASMQSASMQSADGKVFIGYVRNVSGSEVINTRIRQAVQTMLTLRPLKPGSFQIWDLDQRTVIKRLHVEKETTLDLGKSGHDFAVVRVGD